MPWLKSPLPLHWSELALWALSWFRGALAAARCAGCGSPLHAIGWAQKHIEGGRSHGKSAAHHPARARAAPEMPQRRRHSSASTRMGALGSAVAGRGRGACACILCAHPMHACTPAGAHGSHPTDVVGGQRGGSHRRPGGECPTPHARAQRGAFML
ncbi:MAG: hypothetical protein J3K34DRAFT_417423 [Monoraphidium minutum]|nr:MAG: hypothetical protein J3K34DRAFT_417423 [Monoraphidium minutum]